MERPKFEINTEGLERVPDLVANEQIEKEIDFDAMVQKLDKKSPFLLDGDIYFNEEAKFLRVLARLVYELKVNIDDYDTILGDDASGRLVTLVIRKIANEARKHLKKEPVKTFFVAAGRRFIELGFEQKGWEEREGVISDFLISKGKGFGKTLFVTEHIETGKSLQIMADLLKQAGISFDVAAVSVNQKNYQSVRNFLETTTGSQLYYGELGGIGAVAQHGKNREAGVSKQSSRSAHSVRFLSDLAVTKAAREDVDYVAEEFKKLL